MNRALVVLSLAGACSCNALLGIEEAHVDPQLEALRSQVPSDDVDGGSALSSRPADSPNGGAPSAPPMEPTPEAALTAASDDDGPPVDDVDDAVDDAADDDAPPTPPEAEDDDGSEASSQEDDADDSSETPDDEPADDDVTPAEIDAGIDPASSTVDAGAESVCDKYCEEVTEQCVGEMEQYRDRLQCLAVCELFPEGDLASDENENTAACRLRYASQARYAAGTEQSAYCRQAGPGGDGRCGSNCEGYCTLMMQVCSPEETDIFRYDSMNDCLDACNALPVSDEPYSTTSLIVADGNHVQCRLFHVTSAAMLDTEEHCEHAIGITLCQAPDD